MMFSAPIQLITYFIAAAVCVGNTSTTQLVDVVECNPSFHVEQSVCRFMCREPGSTVDEIKLERNIVCTSLELVNIKEVNNVVLFGNENLESVTAPGLEYISILRLYFDRRLQKIPILDFIDIERLPQSISIDGSYVIVCINSLPYELDSRFAEILSLINRGPWEGNPCSTRKATESLLNAPAPEKTRTTRHIWNQRHMRSQSNRHDVRRYPNTITEAFLRVAVESKPADLTAALLNHVRTNVQILRYYTSIWRMHS